jgi:hypothetical protein
MDGYGQCRNCLGSDYLVDAERGECTCALCGCVNGDAVLLVASARYKELYDCSGNRQFQAPLVETVRAGVYSETPADVIARQTSQTQSAPYQRATYLAERISQWRGLEPSIPHEDFRDIERLYNRYTNKWGIFPEEQQWEPNYCLSKEDTRKLLWEIDRQRVKADMKPYFVKKYLEKFLTIRLQLCGRGSLGLHVNDYLALRLKELFKALQVPFAQRAVRTGRRHSFISYNFVFRRLFDLLGCSHLGADFPPLKSRKKREDIVSIWLELIAYLGWPYLNSDAQLYGTSHAVDIYPLSHNHRRTLTTHKRARTSHAQHSDHRLRQPCASSESQPHTWRDSDPGLLELCAALCSAAGDRTGGLDNGNHFGMGYELV